MVVLNTKSKAWSESFNNNTTNRPADLNTACSATVVVKISISEVLGQIKSNKIACPPLADSLA